MPPLRTSSPATGSKGPASWLPKWFGCDATSRNCSRATSTLGSDCGCTHWLVASPPCSATWRSARTGTRSPAPTAARHSPWPPHEDPDLQAWVRGTESLSAYYQKRYTDALELARDGQRYAHGGPQMIRLVINGEARALGRLGERSDIDEAVARAYAGVARLPHRAGMSSCISLEPYSEARVEANAATAHLSLGATPKVLDYAATIESPVEESRVDWDRSLVRLDVATALICQQRPDVEHAAGIARSALEESVGKPIEPVRQRAAEFVAQARRWQTRPAMRELAEALRGWNATPLPVPGS